MIDTEKWEAFVAAHPEPAILLDEEKAAMFLHGWDNANRNADEYHEALWQWREEVMRNVEMFSLGGASPDG